MIVTVSYYKVNNMDLARQCHRCRGEGRERNDRRVQCVRCNGSGVHPDGYAYEVPEGLTLELGDVVACPPTPYSNGLPALATVIDLAGEPYPGKPLKTIIRRLGREQESKS
jgi:hypothetical protein